jgi:transposase
MHDMNTFAADPSTEAQGRQTTAAGRACLTGILFVLRSGIPWEMLPQEMGCGSGMTCWRRLPGWHLEPHPLHAARLDGSLRPDRLVAGCGRRQLGACGFWGAKTGPNPTDMAKAGSKRHLICDGQGVPLAIQQPPRLTASSIAGRCHSTAAGRARKAALSSKVRAGGPRL